MTGTDSLLERIGALELKYSLGSRSTFATEIEAWSELDKGEVTDRLGELSRGAQTAPGERVNLQASLLLATLRHALTFSVKPMGLEGAEQLVADRVERAIERAEHSGFLPLSDERTLYDCLVFLGKLIPLGLYHADIGSIPRSLVTRLRAADSWRLLRYVVGEMRGFRPTLGIHLPKQPDRPLSEREFVEAHRLARVLFERNPELLGFYNAAWYYDPAVALVSPHLGFLPRFAASHGALSVSLGSDPDAVADATWKSRRRRELYATGQYLPRRYARIWSRRRFLAWAASPDRAPEPPHGQGTQRSS